MSPFAQIPLADAFERLVVAARSGSNQALGELLDQWRNYLLLVANQQLGNDLRAKAGASDMVQEAFAQAHRSFGSFAGRSQADLSAWLQQILLNQILILRRQFSQSQKRDIRREESLGSDSTLHGLSESSPSPHSCAEASENLAVVCRTLRSLPSDYRQVIQLRYWENLSFQEIGLRMGRSSEAARKCWLRAVQSFERAHASAQRSAAGRFIPSSRC